MNSTIIMIFLSLFMVSTNAWADKGADRVRPFPRYLTINTKDIPLPFDDGGQVWLVNGKVDRYDDTTVTYGFFSGDYCQITVAPEVVDNHLLIGRQKDHVWELKSCEVSDPVADAHYGLCYQGVLGYLHLDCYSSATKSSDNTYSPARIQHALGYWATLSKETIKIRPVIFK